MRVRIAVRMLSALLVVAVVGLPAAPAYARDYGFGYYDPSGGAGQAYSVPRAGGESTAELIERYAPQLGLPTNTPPSYDARADGRVTPVRLQAPWETSWAFGATAALESSLIADAGPLGRARMQTYAATDGGLLSPLHLAWFAREPVAAGPQAGEGPYATESGAPLTAQERLTVGGSYGTLVQALANGWGPAREKSYPYANAEGIYDQQDGPDGVYDWSYSRDGTWAEYPEEARTDRAWQLREAYRIPSTARYERAGGSARVSDDAAPDLATYTFDEFAAYLIKASVLRHGGVGLAYAASEFGPDDEGAYHYVAFRNDTAEANQCVEVIGWDDGYDRHNFAPGLSANDRSRATDADGALLFPNGNAAGERGLPEGDGAWLCKSSWGADGEAFPNGNVDSGDGTFWLSYYDRSIADVACYLADDARGLGAYDLIDQYDYYGLNSADDARVETGAQETWFANVFVAEGARQLCAVSAYTYQPGSRVDVEVYRLAADWTVPDGGELVSATSLTVPLGGWHRVELDAPVDVAAGETFSVVERIRELDVTSAQAARRQGDAEQSGEGPYAYVVPIEHARSQELAAERGEAIFGQVVANERESWVGAVNDEGMRVWQDALVYTQELDDAYGNVMIKAFSRNTEKPKPADAPNGNAGGPAGNAGGSAGKADMSDGETGATDDEVGEGEPEAEPASPVAVAGACLAAAATLVLAIVLHRTRTS